MRVVVLVPRREDGGHRDRVWAYVKEYWARILPWWEVIEGHHDDGGLFNRSAAVNSAAASTGWDVAVVADSDSLVGREQVCAAVALAATSGRLTFGFNEFLYLSREMSGKVREGFSGDWRPGVEWSLGNTESSCVVVPRGLWDEVGGFDPGFRGWGMEDVAFAAACETLGGEALRVPGPVWHLWHPPSRDPAGTVDRNRERLGHYLVAKGDAVAMRRVLSELR